MAMVESNTLERPFPGMEGTKTLSELATEERAKEEFHGMFDKLVNCATAEADDEIAGITTRVKDGLGRRCLVVYKNIKESVRKRTYETITIWDLGENNATMGQALVLVNQSYVDDPLEVSVYKITGMKSNIRPLSARTDFCERSIAFTGIYADIQHKVEPIIAFQQPSGRYQQALEHLGELDCETLEFNLG